MSQQMKHLYEFGPFRLDPSKRLLLRGEELVALSPKAFDTLLVLVKSAGQVLEKGELMRRIWPDSFVEEANLAVNISALRKALGERPGGGQYIETVPKRGYRFTANVIDLAAGAQRGGELLERQSGLGRPRPVAVGGQAVQAVKEPAGGPSYEAEPGFEQRAGTIGQQPQADVPHAGAAVRNYKKSVVALAALAAAALAIGYLTLHRKVSPLKDSAQPRSLAILPFKNVGSDREADFIGFPLADAIITKVSYINSLVVRPSNAIKRYRDLQIQELNPKLIAKELNVDTLLMGTYRKEGNNLSLNAQLIEVTTDKTLWNLPLNLKYDKLMSVQDEVSRRVVDGLQVKLSPAEAERFNREETDDLDAYEYFLRGVDLYSNNQFQEAIRMLQKSVEFDQNFALAHAHLGRAYNAGASFDFGGREYHSKAESHYEQALEDNPELIDATIFMANLYTDTNRVEQAAALLKGLLEKNPNIAEAHWEMGYAYRFAGMLDESVALCERARRLDPQVKINSSAFNSYLYVGRYDDFLKSLPAKEDSAFVVFYRGFGNYYLNNLERAAADFGRAYELKPDLYTQIGKAFSFFIKGQREQALELLQDTERGIEQTGLGDAEAMYKVAQGYSVVGDNASALRMLGRSIERGFFCHPYFVNDPLLENIRSEPAYAALMGMALKRHEDFKRRFL